MAEYLVLTLDVDDPDVQQAFWCGALGYDHVGGVGNYRMLTDPAGRQPRLLLQKVAEHKTAKNRLHLDLHVPEHEAEVARLQALGATLVQRVDEFGMIWFVMHDPEGNEFCVCAV
ncbi:MAG: VOC family protein [Actinomycetota bacterium]|nr:VOC family protein [Actinomycetota bacterium]